MPESSSINNGCYQLILHLCNYKYVQVGKLGSFEFEQGYYIYTGSHQKTLNKRIERHLRQNKKRHWHIDYLTTCQEFNKVAVFIYRDWIDECQIQREFLDFSKAETSHSGFGNGDCTNRCQSHLLYMQQSPISMFNKWKQYFSQLSMIPPLILEPSKFDF